jgi:hypothetical protein
VFADAIRFRAIAVTFVGYVLLSVVLFAIVFQVWIPRGVSMERLEDLAETSRTLLLWQSVLGTVLGVAAGYVAGRLSGGKGLRNSMVVGAILALYGVVGIYLHPSHPLLMQIGKLAGPIPLALTGGWLALRR